MTPHSKIALFSCECVGRLMTLCVFAWDSSALTGRIFIKFGIREFFFENLEKIQVLLKS